MVSPPSLRAAQALGQSQRLTARAAQTAVMTPALQQAIRLLHMNNQELADVVEAALEDNPLLRPEPLADADGTVPSVTAADLSRPVERPGKRSVIQFGSRGAPIFRAQGLWSDRAKRSTGAAPPDGAAPDALAAIADMPALGDHVAVQADILCPDPTDRRIAGRLAGELDEWGYCAADFGALALELGVPPARVERVFQTLRTMEPAGLFATSLADCLALQLADQGKLTPRKQALLDNLDMLGDGDIAGLARACGADGGTLDTMLAELRSLNPHPGADFSHDPVETRIPDLLLRPAPGDGWTVELNPETLPRAMVDRAYAAELRAGRLNPDERRYVREQLQEASWLVRAMDQRAATLLQVAAETLRRQSEALTLGDRALRPLTMGEVGEALDMHLSTISRAVAGKHIATPRGLLALRDFFVGGLPTAGGGTASPAQVQARLKQLVDEEEAPLSDAALADRLAEEGYDIARRTVAKYRDILGIPPSSKRRRRAGSRFRTSSGSRT